MPVARRVLGADGWGTSGAQREVSTLSGGPLVATSAPADKYPRRLSQSGGVSHSPVDRLPTNPAVEGEVLLPDRVWAARFEPPEPDEELLALVLGRPDESLLGACERTPDRVIKDSRPRFRCPPDEPLVAQRFVKSDAEPDKRHPVGEHAARLVCGAKPVKDRPNGRPGTEVTPRPIGCPEHVRSLSCSTSQEPTRKSKSVVGMGPIIAVTTDNAPSPTAHLPAPALVLAASPPLDRGMLPFGIVTAHPVAPWARDVRRSGLKPDLLAPWVRDVRSWRPGAARTDHW